MQKTDLFLAKLGSLWTREPNEELLKPDWTEVERELGSGRDLCIVKNRPADIDCHERRWTEAVGPHDLSQCERQRIRESRSQTSFQRENRGPQVTVNSTRNSKLKTTGSPQGLIRMTPVNRKNLEPAQALKDQLLAKAIQHLCQRTAQGPHMFTKADQKARRQSKGLENRSKIPAQVDFRDNSRQFSDLADLITNKSNELAAPKPSQFAATAVGFGTAAHSKEPSRTSVKQKMEPSDLGGTIAHKFALIFKKDGRNNSRAAADRKPNVSHRVESHGTNKSFGMDPSAHKPIYLNTDWAPSGGSAGLGGSEFRGRTSENVHRRKEATSLSKHIRNAMRKLEF